MLNYRIHTGICSGTGFAAGYWFIVLDRSGISLVGCRIWYGTCALALCGHAGPMCACIVWTRRAHVRLHCVRTSSEDVSYVSMVLCQHKDMPCVHDALMHVLCMMHACTVLLCMMLVLRRNRVSATGYGHWQPGG